MSPCRCHRHTWMVRIVWPDTVLNLAEAAELLGGAWQVSRQQPWVQPVGTFAVAARCKSSVGGTSFTVIIPKVFLCLPARHCVFCPLFFFLWYLLGIKPTGTNVLLSCLSLPSTGITSISKAGSLWFFKKSLKPSFTPCLHTFAKPLWGSLLETLALIFGIALSPGCFSCLVSGNTIFPSSMPSKSVRKSQSRRKAWLEAGVLLESVSERFKHQDSGGSKAGLGGPVLCLGTIFPRFSLSLLPKLIQQVLCFPSPVCCEPGLAEPTLENLGLQGDQVVTAFMALRNKSGLTRNNLFYMYVRSLRMFSPVEIVYRK